MSEIKMRSPDSRDISTQNIILFVGLVGACITLFALRQVILLALAAIIIAILLTDVTHVVKKTTGLSRFKAFGLALIAIILSIMTISWVFGAQISSQISELATKLPSAIGQFEQRLNGTPAGQGVVTAITEELKGAGAGIATLVARAGGLAFGFFDVVIQSIIVLSAAIFLASHPRAYRGSLLRLLPKPQRKQVKTLLDRSATSISGWMLGTLFSMSITASLVLVCLLLLGVPAPIALALLAGLSQIVPVIGPVVSACLGIILAATVSFEVAGIVALSYLVISQLEANVITPTILREAVKIPPAMILFSILIMGTLFGSLGVVLAIPAFLIVSDSIEVARASVKVSKTKIGNE